jgi:hypothetical protein
MSTSALARTCVALFAISSLMPVVASILYVSRDPPRWVGVLDVVLATMLFLVSVLVTSRVRRDVSDVDRVRAWRISQVVLFTIPLLLALWFLLGPHVRWDVLVAGLAWRGWLLLYTLPFLSAASTPARES